MNIKKHEIKVAFVFTLMLNSKQQPPWLQMVNVFKVKQFNFFLTFWKGSAKKKVDSFILHVRKLGSSWNTAWAAKTANKHHCLYTWTSLVEPHSFTQTASLWNLQHGASCNRNTKLTTHLLEISKSLLLSTILVYLLNMASHLEKWFLFICLFIHLVLLDVLLMTYYQ